MQQSNTQQLYIALFAAIQLALLISWSLKSLNRTKLSIASAALSFVDSLFFCLLSYKEHSRSLRPSALLGTYLFFSLIFDAVRLRTLWHLERDQLIRALFTSSLLAKFMLLLLEARDKRIYLNSADRLRGPEETSSIFNLSMFWWLNDLFLRGFRKVLLLDDLFPIDHEMQSDYLSVRFAQKWAARK
jgi:ATP-binding cassette subfamily C (CFTR/MRP) protein 1